MKESKSGWKRQAKRKGGLVITMKLDEMVEIRHMGELVCTMDLREVRGVRARIGFNADRTTVKIDRILVSGEPAK